MTKRTDTLDEEVDALFRLPSAEFTDARNRLAAQLKKRGRGEEAQKIRALAKPPISAWVVNHLYWNHRQAFDQLIASGERFHKAQKSGKVADMREALDARRESLSKLSETAASVMTDAGHNPSLDIVRRVNATLEAISVFARRSDAPRPGRLTHDVDPPGFESFGSFSSAGGVKKATKEPSRVTPALKPAIASSNARAKKAAGSEQQRRVEEIRNKRITAARVSLQEAKSALNEARATAKSLEAAKKKADGEAKKTELQKRALEEDLKKAKAASEQATKYLRSIELENKAAVKSVNDAQLAVEKATQALELLLGK